MSLSDHAGLPRLSKSRFQTGLQCPKALYLACYFPSRKDEIGPDQQAIMDSGMEVGRLARSLFPDGYLVEDDYLHGEDALRTTMRALGRHPAVFEAAFDAEDVLVRLDVLEDLGRAYGLTEVKSSTRVKDEHVTDVGIQWYVAEKSGIPLGRARVMFIDNTYVYPGGDVDLAALLRSEDVTERVRAFLPSVPGLLEGMRAVLTDREHEPAAEVGPQCSKPHDCPFTGYCRQGVPAHHVSELPLIGAKAAELLAAGFTTIPEIPDTWKLNAAQARHRRCVIEDRLRVMPAAQAELAKLAEPLHFLDFETSMTALPRVVGTRPYQQICFQWSDHLYAGGAVTGHREFLADTATPDEDPRPAFIESLLADLEEDGGSIVVYSSFEGARMREIAEAHPQYADRIAAVLERLFDLERLVRSYVNHPDFHGRTSIKAVLPALTGEDFYGKLEVHNGSEAIAAYLRLSAEGVDPAEKAALRAALLEYCGTDTMAMVRVYEAIRDAVAVS